MSKNTSMTVQGHNINMVNKNDVDWISLTDIASSFGDSSLIDRWLRNTNTIEYLAAWEAMSNPNFNSLEFEGIRNESGANRFSLSVKRWVESTKAVGIVSRSGRYGGTYAHKDIATEFCTWLSPTFKLYLIKEFERLKAIETSNQTIEWNVKRVISKANYHLHTNAIKEHRIPEEHIAKEKEGIIYADEAEILNYAVFGCSSKTWKTENSELALKGFNIRDFASINELAVLSNMESINSIMLASKMARNDRMHELRRLAQQQLRQLDSLDFEKSYKKTIGGEFHPKSIEQSQPLSDHNQKLKQALNYNPKDKEESPE